MALTNQPYLPLYVQDWLSNNKLKLCSIGSHGLMINIMCVLHKEKEYGTILLKQKYKQNASKVKNFACMFAKLLPFDLVEVEQFLSELIDESILLIENDKLICDRMVRDAALSEKRAIAGGKGGRKTGKKFAIAKPQANAESENETVIESDNEIVNKNKGKHLFKNSDFFDLNKFIIEIETNEKYIPFDCEYYHESAKNWSAEGNMKKNWIATVRNWMLRDLRDGKPKLKGQYTKIFNQKPSRYYELYPEYYNPDGTRKLN